MRPVVQTQKKDEARRRGDPKTQTSDARFDAQFAVMYGLAGRAPWYARHDVATPQAARDERHRDAAHIPGAARSAPEAERRQKQRDPAHSDRSADVETKRHKSKKDRKHKRRRRSSDPDSPPAKVCRGGSGANAFAALREERLAREAAEAARSRVILQQKFTR